MRIKSDIHLNVRILDKVNHTIINLFFDCAWRHYSLNSDYSVIHIHLMFKYS